jgi:hypothetical protein
MTVTDLPKFKFSSLKEAKAEMLKFGITEKASTIGQARALLLLKRGEMVRSANRTKPITLDVSPAVATIAPVATAKAPPVSKSVFDVAEYLALRAKQISGVWMNKSELASLSVCDDTTSVLEDVISILSKTEYREGVLLSNAYIALQKSEETKHIDPRDILEEIKSSKAIALKSERAKKSLANLRTSSN